MIQLKKQGGNQISLNLRDNDIDGDGQHYLFEFDYKYSKKVYLIPTVLSDNQRAVILDIDASSLEYGQHNVNIYRQSNSTNVDPASSVVDGLVLQQQAFVELNDATQSFKSYIPQIADSKIYVRS